VSVQAMAWVYDHERTTTGSDRLVLLSIANHADKNGANAWPSVATMAVEANVSVRTVRYSLGQLVDGGLIEVERQAGGMADTRPDRRPNRYRIIPMAGDNPPDGVQPVAPRASRGVQTRTERGASQRENGVQTSAAEPSLEPSILNSEPEPEVVEKPTDPETVAAALDLGRAGLRTAGMTGKVQR
jgi:hypothetical protein